MRDAEHVVELVVHPTWAELRVDRVLANASAAPDEAFVSLSLPAEGAITGLSLLGQLGGSPVWMSADLEAPDKARARYQGTGETPGDGALLVWNSSSNFALRVFPVPAFGQRHVRYTAVVPTTWEAGRAHVRLGRTGVDGNRARLLARAASADERVVVDGSVVGGALRLDKDELDVTLERPRAPALDGELAMIPLSEHRAVFSLRVDGAARMSKVPERAAVVVALDTSRSMGAERLAASLLVAKSYLAELPRAEAEVLTFDRHVRARHGRLVPIADARADLAELAPTPGNGSGLDAALAEADKLLARAPAGAARRIVVLSDRLTRARLDPSKLASLGSGAVVHLVAVEPGGASLSSVDEDPWAPVARATGGLVWRGTAEANDEAAERVFTELVRPVRLHRFEVKAPGIDDLVAPAELVEGEGVSDLRIAPHQVPWVRARGELWSRPVEIELRPDERARRTWSALVASESSLDVTPAERATLAAIGHAASSETSFVVARSGARPPESHGIGGIGGRGISGGSRDFVGGSSCGRRRPPFDHEGWLAGALEAGWKRCGGGPVRFEIESTWREVVDVTAESSEASRELPAAARDCLDEVGWAIDLPDAFDFERHAWTVTLGS